MLLRLDIPGFLRPLYESFRVTGRFATPLAVLLMAWVALWWCAWRHRLPRHLWAAIAAVAVFLQAADARHAGKLSPPADWQADAVAQQEALAGVPEGEVWSGTVFQSMSLRQLEEHRLLDYLLIKQGADLTCVSSAAYRLRGEVAMVATLRLFCLGRCRVFAWPYGFMGQRWIRAMCSGCCQREIACSTSAVGTCFAAMCGAGRWERYRHWAVRLAFQSSIQIQSRLLPFPSSCFTRGYWIRCSILARSCWLTWR